MKQTGKRKIESMGHCDLCGYDAGTMLIYHHKKQRLCEDHYLDEGLRRNALMNKTEKSKYKQRLQSAFTTLFPRNRRDNNAPDSTL